jgi:cysteine synthase A
MIGVQVFLKMETNNIGGSVKDRTAKEIILNALKRGDLSEGDHIVEGTSGSTGIALSLIANVKNLSSKIILPNNLAQEKYKLLELFNANLIKVPPRSFVDEENYVRMAEKYEGSKSDNVRSFYCDQFDNFDNFWVHFNETGPEIYEQMEGQIDYFVCSAGTSGTISGISKFLKSKLANVKTILADCEGSSLFSYVNSGVLYTAQDKEVNKKRTPDYTVIEGIGQNRLTKNFLRGQIDKAFKVGDCESMHMSHFLIQNEGLFLGGSSCLNLVAICKLVHYLKSKVGISEDKLRDLRVVTIANDSGYRYLSKFYNDEYVKKYGINFEKQESYDQVNFINYDY